MGNDARVEAHKKAGAHLKDLENILYYQNTPDRLRETVTRFEQHLAPFRVSLGEFQAFLRLVIDRQFSLEFRSPAGRSYPQNLIRYTPDQVNTVNGCIAECRAWRAVQIAEKRACEIARDLRLTVGGAFHQELRGFTAIRAACRDGKPVDPSEYGATRRGTAVRWVTLGAFEKRRMPTGFRKGCKT